MKRQTFRTLGIVRVVDDNDSPDVEQTIDAEEIDECVVEVSKPSMNAKSTLTP